MANQLFTPDLAHWVFSQAWFPKEQESAWHELWSPELWPENDRPTDETLEIFLNQWIIYDRPTSTHHRTPLELFIDAKVKQRPVERSVFEGFKQSWVGAFGLEAIQPLQSMLLLDLASGRRFEVQEQQGTVGPQVGDVMLARILPFGQTFLIGASYGLVQQPEAVAMRYTWDRLRRDGPLPPLTAPQLAPFIIQPTPALRKWQLIVELDDFLRAKKYAVQSATAIVREFERLDDPNGVLRRLLNEVPLKTTAEVNTLSRLIIELWNAFQAKVPRRGEPGAGPIETAIIHDLLTKMQVEQPTSHLNDSDQAKRFGEEWYQRYLHLPQAELHGRTPWQMILAERQERGNPDTGWHYEFSAQPVPNPAVAKFQRLLDNAVAAHQDKKFGPALRQYKKLLSYGDDQVPEIWRIYGNAGACACELNDFDAAEEYFKKALRLNPNYSLAKKNLRRLKKFRASGQQPPCANRPTA